MCLCFQLMNLRKFIAKNLKKNLGGDLKAWFLQKLTPEHCYAPTFLLQNPFSTLKLQIFAKK